MLKVPRYYIVEQHFSAGARKLDYHLLIALCYVNRLLAELCSVYITYYDFSGALTIPRSFKDIGEFDNLWQVQNPDIQIMSITIYFNPRNEFSSHIWFLGAGGWVGVGVGYEFKRVQVWHRDLLTKEMAINV